jgi:hypothetical protein
MDSGRIVATCLNSGARNLLPNYYICDLLRTGLLVLLKPDKPNHPQQAYHTKQESLK